MGLCRAKSVRSGWLSFAQIGTTIGTTGPGILASAKGSLHQVGVLGDVPRDVGIGGRLHPADSVLEVGLGPGVYVPWASGFARRWRSCAQQWSSSLRTSLSRRWPGSPRSSAGGLGPQAVLLGHEIVDPIADGPLSTHDPSLPSATTRRTPIGPGLMSASRAGRYLPVRSRCLHPGQQQGRRWPSSSSSWVRRMRRSRVVSCLASSTQQMNSLRAKGVMSFQASSAVALAISALRRSAGSLCTTPPGTLWPLTGPW
jgi:hypothetical protein